MVENLSEKDLSKIAGGTDTESSDFTPYSETSGDNYDIFNISYQQPTSTPLNTLKDFAKGYGLGLIAPIAGFISSVQSKDKLPLGFSLGVTTSIGTAVGLGACIALLITKYKNK